MKVLKVILFDNGETVNLLQDDLVVEICRRDRVVEICR